MVLKNGNISFLSLLLAVERFTQICDGLVFISFSKTLPTDDKKNCLILIAVDLYLSFFYEQFTVGEWQT